MIQAVEIKQAGAALADDRKNRVHINNNRYWEIDAQNVESKIVD